MTKRPSIIGGLDLPNGAPEPEKAAPARRARPDIVHTSIYLPREVHRRLREIAFARDVKIHDVIMEGIDAALRKHGHPSVEALKIGSKPAS
ncbi:hypothetical protein [Methylobacterium oryzihabitans]|uniref:CopG family transcriptional regulator n=1 Tax=Methylobacterium oryzihabitans TaxID=2499852 RepID=A0A3S2V651_9HYPH|nr:hypothetical protein [Methylobacterium oryzihabitans]RVU14564.1 hypothetical protein EOE48_22775 [Methylobacterium oryzihabitans]